VTEGLTPLELAAGTVVGTEDGMAVPEPGGTPLAALERAVLAAIRRPPCLVSFSGGIDSSLVLAVAVRVARREGMPDPVPLTWRFEDAPRAQESHWQERVIAELGVRDWERLGADADELDVVGPVAARVLSSCGVVYPANAYLHEPLLRRAAGGTLLTGVGGDQVPGLWRGRPFGDLIGGRRLPSWRDPVRLARIASHRQPGLAPPWLRPHARRELERLHRRELASDRLRWAPHVRFALARREVALGQRTLRLIADRVGAGVLSPLLDPAFACSAARAGGRAGFGSRLETVRALFADAFPRALLSRSDKALFDQVLWREPARAAIRSWDGRGLEPELVDAETLRAVWSGDPVDSRSALLLQSVFLRARSQYDPVG
jgi:asparagine synthase (glutamine-hydrolysing)